ncbi:MAG: glycoside hydrolase family 3 protein [Minisyncoccia bacterium]
MPSGSERTYPLLFAIGVICLLLMSIAQVMTLPPSLDDARYYDLTIPVEERANDLLSRMTLDEKIGQMALVEKNSIPLRHVSRYGIGAILSGGGGKPEQNTPEGWRAMTTGFITESRASRTGIPIFYGIDANHGQGNVPGATIFPHQIGLGAVNDPALVENIAKATAKESRAIGAQWIYSPSLDLPTDIRWGRVYEAFSSNAAITSSLGAAMVRGLQESRVLATPKHFIGLGSMLWGTSSNENFQIDQGTTPPDETLLRSAYLPPFKSAITSGAMSVMVGMNGWGDEKISGSRYLITDILKGELGFSGFVVSDWYGVYEISESKYESTVRAINAGVDMVMLPYEYETFIRDVKRAVHRGEISRERIDDAARRILQAKFVFGLFDTEALPPLSMIGSPEHRALAREAAARSLVVLKNDGALPLSRGTRLIRVAGSAADNIGMQAGAWTYEWQGIDGNWLPGATSILAGLRAASPNTEFEYEKEAHFAENTFADIGIAIVGEKPYAEGWGDNANPRLRDEDLVTIERLRGSVRTLIVVIVSGRPLIVTNELPTWDTLVAAWLPGSEGRGVADALFGDVPTGTLPIAWPRSMEQVPISSSGRTSDGSPPLFPRGFGLSTEIVL